MRDESYSDIHRGDAPILVAAPHIGTAIPADLMSESVWRSVEGRGADAAGAMLRAVAAARGISCIAGRIHPCVIDFNVAAGNRMLYSGLETNLCRTHTARGESLYRDVGGPSDSEVTRRIEQYWMPYHEELGSELQRLRRMHDNVLLLVSHAGSRLSPYPQQFGVSDCNVGTSRGASCDRRLVTTLTGVVRDGGRSWVVNGRMADTFAAQHYGVPAAGIHVMEVEFAGDIRQDCEGGGADCAVTRGLFELMLDGFLETLSTLPNVEVTARAELGFRPNG
ncbi:N-formylglutamate amidohydrolase [Burkholderia ambifaria]|uniref:N-formylglutamate amidohydrolase n=1 Tax=Burkholderia ambifaria TaxID=152480 RepID=UPI001B8EE6CB|nr:N-formylglutamate amidohydrolase [Burkholderia ambifaria]MBR8184221.1 N-formylglutamate amidohydrolase [Burkholderia ambifaria]